MIFLSRYIFRFVTKSNFSENQTLVTKTEQFEGNQIIIMNDTETYEEMYSEQQDQITYLDETGNEIGTGVILGN